MTMTYYYRVAGFLFSICLPVDKDVEELLPSFRPFMATRHTEDRCLFGFTIVTKDAMSDCEEKDLLEETNNDMGHLNLYATSKGYMVEVIHGNYMHQMTATRDFVSVKACLQWEDKNAGNALSSLLRITYAQAILRHEAVSIHAAAVYKDGKAYLFMGKSGTGKSTHASLWKACLPGTELLNDDNPTIRIVEGEAYTYGTPWSGKTACYKNLAFPIGGMVRLNQAQANRFYHLEGADAFIALYPGCSVIAEDKELRNRLYDTLARLADMVRIGTMDCLPDQEAACICHHALAQTVVESE